MTYERSLIYNCIKYTDKILYYIFSKELKINKKKIIIRIIKFYKYNNRAIWRLPIYQTLSSLQCLQTTSTEPIEITNKNYVIILLYSKV